MLSCYYDYDPEPGDVCWFTPNSIEPLKRFRATKCQSCKKRIAPGDLAAEFRRYKVPEHDIEIAIYGDDYDQGPPRASHYLCQDCGNIYLFLERFGYALNPEMDMRELSAEHGELAKAGQAGCL